VKTSTHAPDSHDELELNECELEHELTDSELELSDNEDEEEDAREMSICTELTRIESPLIHRNHTRISLSSAAVLVVAKLYSNSLQVPGSNCGANICSLPI